MYIFRLFVGALTVMLLCSCAVNPEVEAARQAKETEVERILTETSEYGEAKRCLRSHEYRNFEILDDRRIIFSGRRDKLWLNQLRSSCPGLRTGHALKFVSLSGSSQICDLDSFEVVDFFYYPRFQRWPWQWFGGVRCTLGRFEPVTEQQAAALKMTLKPR